MDISVFSIMRAKVPTSPVTSTLKTIAQKIIDEDAGSVLVRDDQDIVGIITEKDLLRAVLQHKDLETTQAGDVMTSPLDFCDAEDSLETCMEIFKKTGRTRLVVMKEGKAVGVIRRKILERFLSTSKRYSLAHIAKTPRFRTGRG